MSVLVTYATSHGSTREIAERIAARVRAQVDPTPVDCIPVSAVPALHSVPQKYSAILVGSAVHVGRWVGPGRSFVKRNALFLNGDTRESRNETQPQDSPPRVWAFSVGMPLTEQERVKEEAALEKALRARLTGDTLRGHRLFMGKFEKEHLGWFFRMFLSCCGSEDNVHWGDGRDWNDIDGWADEVGRRIAAGGLDT